MGWFTYGWFSYGVIHLWGDSTMGWFTVNSALQSQQSTNQLTSDTYASVHYTSTSPHKFLTQLLPHGKNPTDLNSNLWKQMLHLTHCLPPQLKHPLGEISPISPQLRLNLYILFLNSCFFATSCIWTLQSKISNNISIFINIINIQFQ